MLKRLVLVVCLLMAGRQAWAVEAAPVEVVVTQADTGETFTVLPKGNEYANWMETTDGYSVVETGGIWYYAKKAKDGSLVSSGIRAGAPGAKTVVNLPRHLRPDVDWSEVEQFEPVDIRKLNRGSKSLVFTQKVVVVLVNFSDIDTDYSDASFESLMFSGAGSVKDFFLENSYNNYTIAPAAETQGTANDGIINVTMGFAHPDFGTNFTGWRGVADDFMTAADPFINYAAFDTNANGSLSATELGFVFILAGYENAYGGEGASHPRAWGHVTSLSSPVTLDAKSMASYTIFGERHADHQATIGIMAHELGHLVLGLPDLYDSDGGSQGIGTWSLMSGGSWGAFGGEQGSSPAHLDAWCKYATNITTPEVITAATNGVSLLKADANASMKKLWIDKYKTPRGEYFLLENRQQSGYDQSLPSHGLLVWHIDASISSNANPLHKWVDLEEADGLAQLDSNSSSGDAGDPFPGSSNKTTFTGASNPNSDDYDGNDTGIVVNGISASSSTMTANLTPRTGDSGDHITYQTSNSLTGSWYENNTVYTGLNVSNSSAMDTLDGLEIYCWDAGTVDVRIYESHSGGVPQNQLHVQNGFAVTAGWNRLMLTTPQSYPLGATRFIVLKIVGNTQGVAPIDASGANAGVSYISSNGTAFAPLANNLWQSVLVSGFTGTSPVYVNFSYAGAESGSLANPFNTFAEGLAAVSEGGILNLNGNAADKLSGFTGTITKQVTIKADPVGIVRVGVTGGGS